MTNVTIEEEVPAPVRHKPKGIILSWTNVQGGKISLLKSDFVFPKLFFHNLVVNWHCGNISKNVLTYRLLVTYNVRKIKHGRQKLNMMRYLIKHVHKVSEIVNMLYLVVRDYTPKNSRLV